MAVPSFVSAIGGFGVNPCTPGSDVWVTPGGNHSLSVWFYVGICPAGGTISCNASTNMGVPAQSWAQNCQNYGLCTGGATSGTCFQAAAYSGGGGGGGSGGTTEITGEVTLAPFEYTAAQQAEVYAALGVVFGVTLAALAAIWGGRRVLSLLLGQQGGNDS